MNKKIFGLFLFLFFIITPHTFAIVKSPQVTTVRGQVISTKEISIKNPAGVEVKTEELSIKILEGSDMGKIIKSDYDFQDLEALKIQNGETLVLNKQVDLNGNVSYSVNDRFRLPMVIAIIIIFAILIVIIAGKKGIGALIGIIISLGIIFAYIVPSILSGGDPLITCIIGGTAILLLTTYIAHGFSVQTTIALVSTFFALAMTLLISLLVTNLSSLTGFGTEEAYDLHLGLKTLVDFKGLLLGGIIIATLGALNDVTTTQAAAIFEIHKADPKLNFDQLLKRGLMVGREHVISLVNTLVLAFVGSSLALFLVYFFNPSGQSLFSILNSEIISEEIIRTIAGTSGLLLAMPIVTILAAFICVDIIGEKHKSS